MMWPLTQRRLALLDHRRGILKKKKGTVAQKAGFKEVYRVESCGMMMGLLLSADSTKAHNSPSLVRVNILKSTMQACLARLNYRRPSVQYKNLIRRSTVVLEAAQIKTVNVVRGYPLVLSV